MGENLSLCRKTLLKNAMALGCLHCVCYHEQCLIFHMVKCSTEMKFGQGNTSGTVDSGCCVSDPHAK